MAKNINNMINTSMRTMQNLYSRNSSFSYILCCFLSAIRWYSEHSRWNNMFQNFTWLWVTTLIEATCTLHSFTQFRTKVDFIVQLESTTVGESYPLRKAWSRWHANYILEWSLLGTSYLVSSPDPTLSWGETVWWSKLNVRPAHAFASVT